MSNDLPPRPPEQFIEYGHTDAAMLAYGRACERAAYERAAKILLDSAGDFERTASESRLLRVLADSITELGADK